MEDPKPIHRLSAIDEASKTATCAVCGPVSIRPRKGRRGAECMTSRRQHRARTRPTALAKRRGRYGLTEQAMSDLVCRADGRCEICKREMRLDEAHIDHAHDSGLVRGLLCRTCNIGLGFFRDDPALMRTAIRYLESAGPTEA